MEYIYRIFSILYTNFSFPLFFLIFIFVFRKQIISLFERLIFIEKTKNGAKLEFANTEDYFKKADDLEANIKDEYGEDILNQKAGGGGVTNIDNSEELLIYNSNELQSHFAKFGPFKTVNDLYISYRTVKKTNDLYLTLSENDLSILDNKFVKSADNLIKDFYEFSLKSKFENKILQEKDIFNYRNLIKETLILRQNLVINEKVDTEDF